MMLEIKFLAWDRHTNVAGLNQFMRSQTIIQKFILKQCYIFGVYVCPDKPDFTTTCI
jgi:hypothetical protein